MPQAGGMQTKPGCFGIVQSLPALVITRSLAELLGAIMSLSLRSHQKAACSLSSSEHPLSSQEQGECSRCVGWEQLRGHSSLLAGLHAECQHAGFTWGSVALYVAQRALSEHLHQMC